MRYVKGGYEDGFCGCDETIFQSFEDNTPDDEIDEYFSEGIHDWVKGYEYLVLGWEFEPETEEEQEEIDQYYENCNWWWEEITEKEYKEGLEEYGYGYTE